METANLVTYSDLWQVLGIFAGIWFAYFSLVISLLVGWYIRDTNRRDKDVDRRFGELESDIDRRFKEWKRILTGGSEKWKQILTGGSEKWKRPMNAGTRSC